MPSNTSKSKNTSSSSKSTGTSQSKSATVKEGWGSRNNFQASYGLKGPSGYEEGTAILDAMKANDARAARDAGK